MYWYSASGLAYNVVTIVPSLIWMVISIKMIFLHGFSNVHVSPLPLAMVLKSVKMVVGVGCRIVVVQPDSNSVINKSFLERKVFLEEWEDVYLFVDCNVQI